VFQCPLQLPMIRELEPNDFGTVAHVFQGHKQYVPVFAVIEGDFPGRVFVDEAERPGVALVWAISRWAYIDGNPLIGSFNKSLSRLVQDIVIPCSRQMKMNWFELYTSDSTEWATTIEKSLGEYQPRKHLEIIFRFDKQKHLALKTSLTLPEGAWIERRDFPILTEEAREALSVTDRFRAKTSFGFAMVRDGKTISVCRSNGFVSGKEFMIDVQTLDPAERRKGHATAVGTALIDFCLENGYIPLWETTLDNVPSRKLAKKLGFVESESYPVYAIEFQQ
jgi:RimJ/RimL family protein N-acetyltransferase